MQMKGTSVNTREPKTAHRYIGEKFGMWTVSSFSHSIIDDRKYSKAYYYNCECDCGTKKQVALSNLKSKTVGGCGCNVKRRIDLTGQKINEWTVLEFVKDESKNQLTYWRCQCSCEHKTIKLVESNALRNGLTKGCSKCRADRMKKTNQAKKD